MDTEQTKKYIIENLKLENLSPDEQGEIIKKLGDDIEKKAFIVILKALDKKEQKELLAISEKGSIEEINTFIKEKIPNVKEIIEKVAKKTVEDFKRKI